MKSVFALLAALFLFHQPGAKAADLDGAKTFVADLGAQTIAILEQPNLTVDEALRQFRALFRSGFDIPTIGQFVLGRHWRTATPEQRQDYLQLFEDMIIETYARRFDAYSGQTMRVGGARPEGEHDAMVQSQIIRGNGPPINVVWRVRDRGDRFQIIDVVVEGVSMSVTQRNEFNAVIQNGGGSIEALLAAMRSRIAQATNQS